MLKWLEKWVMVPLSKTPVSQFILRWMGAQLDKIPQRQADGHYTTMYLYRRIGDYIRPYWIYAVISVFITMPIGSIDAAIAMSLRPYMDSVLISRSMSTSNFVPLVIVGLTTLQGACTYMLIYFNGYLAVHITRDLRAALFKKLQQLDVSYFDQNTTGTIIQRFYADPEYIQTNLISSTKEFLTRFFTSVSLTVVLLTTSWKLAIMALFCLGGILFPLTRIKKILRSLNQQMTTSFTDLLSSYSETYQGIRIIYGYNLPKRRLDEFLGFQSFIIKTSLKMIKNQGWMTPSMHMIASIGIALVIWFGTQMVAKGELTGGSFVSFFVALIMLYNPVKNIGNTIISTHGTLMAAGRVMELLDQDVQIKDRPGATLLQPIQNAIEFKNVWFEYVEDQPVIKDFNLHIPKGQTVALVGNSGGGKTTITNLLCRFYDITKGTITIDGVDIRDVTLESLRNEIGLVMQDNFLFNTSIKSNVMFGNEHATEEQVWEALEKSYLTSFVESLPDGIETVIGERGVMLSGGQKQRLAIARALLKDAPIVILDEATSALDNESEVIVQKAIESLMKDRTVITIAHRLSTIRNAHRIIVLNQGEIAEEGNHDELLALNGIYSKLYYTQFNPDKLVDMLRNDDVKTAVVADDASLVANPV